MPTLKQGESTYNPVPAGAHPGRCVGMISLGTQPPSNPTFKPSFKVILEFEFPNEQVVRDGKSVPMVANHFLNAYLGNPKKPSKTNLFLTAWRGRAFTEQELQGFDLAKVVGAPCLLNIVHESKDGKTRDVIASISPLPKGMTMPGQVNASRIYEIEEGRNDKFKSLPEWMQKMIEKCEEWNAPAEVQEHPEDNPPHEDGTDVPF